MAKVRIDYPTPAPQQVDQRSVMPAMPALPPSNPLLSLFGLGNLIRPVQATPAPRAIPSPVANYGTNDTGRTTPFNPNPSFSNNTTLPMSAPTWPSGSGGAPMPFGGFLGAIISAAKGKGGETYEAALRERPADIQRLVSMSRLPPDQRSSNSGGFLGGLFDNRG